MINKTKVKKLLIQYKEIKWIIEDINMQIEEVETRMTSIRSSCNISGMPRSNDHVTMDDILANKMELISRKLRFERMAKQKKEIVQAYIDTIISVKHNRLLTDYYIRCMNIDEIAYQEHYTDRHAYRLFNEALDMIDLSIDL